MTKKIILIVLSIVVLVFVALVGYYFMQTNASASDSAEEIVFSIQEGEGVKEIGANLESAGLIKNNTIFKWHVFLMVLSRNLWLGIII